MKSVSQDLTRTDLKKRLVNIAKYVALPWIIYILTQLQLGNPIDMKVIYSVIIGALLDIAHRWASDNTKPI